MQIDFSDKRVIAATATAGIVAIVIIVLQSLILMGSRPTSVTYAPSQSTAVPGWSKEKLDLLKELTEENRRSLNVDRDWCNKQGGDYEEISGNCITTKIDGPMIREHCTTTGGVYVEKLGRCVRER